MFTDFRKRGRDRETEREREKHRCERETSIGCLHKHPDQGLNLQPVSVQDTRQPSEPPSQGIQYMSS